MLARLTLTASAVLTLAGTALAARAWDVNSPLFYLGLALLIVGSLGLDLYPLASRRVNLERAYEAGYDAGYERGRRQTALKVVRMRPRRSAQKR